MHRTQRLSKTSLRLISRGEERNFYPHKIYQLIESFYFHYWTGNSTEPTRQGSPFPPVSFRQRDANIANLLVSTWAQNYSHSVLLPILAKTLSASLLLVSFGFTYITNKVESLNYPYHSQGDGGSGELRYHDITLNRRALCL